MGKISLYKIVVPNLNAKEFNLILSKINLIEEIKNQNIIEVIKEDIV